MTASDLRLFLHSQTSSAQSDLSRWAAAGTPPALSLGVATGAENPVGAGTQLPALPTVTSPARGVIGIVGCKFMSVNAMRLPCLAGAKSNAAQNIRSWRNRLKMRRINTRSIAAKVIYLKPSRDRANQKPVCKSVSKFGVPTNSELAVSQVLRAGPIPAPIGDLFNVAPKSFFGCSVFSGHFVPPQKGAGLTGVRLSRSPGPGWPACKETKNRTAGKRPRQIQYSTTRRRGQ